jgi:hypothetical protein
MKMRNLNMNLPRVRWLIIATAIVGCLAAMLYIVPPTSGRAFTKNSFPVTTGSGGGPGIPGGVPLLW